MPVSNSYDFNLDILNIIEEAYENVGIEAKAGYDLQTARRSLDLLLTEWVNEGINLWTVEEVVIPLIASQNTYYLDSRYMDVMDIVLRDSQGNDTIIERYSMEEYLNLPDKESCGRPNIYSTFRERDRVAIKLWQVPSNPNPGSLVMYAFRYIQNIGAYSNVADVSRRFLPALCAGLAYKLAQKLPRPPDADLMAAQIAVKNDLKAEYLAILNQAKEEDRERSPLVITFSRRRR